MTAARRRAPAEQPPPLLKAIERIAEGKPRPGVRIVETPTPPAPAERDLDAPDEVIETRCGRRIERHAGRLLVNRTDHETGEVHQVELRTREQTYTLWEPAAEGDCYTRTKVIAAAGVAAPAEAVPGVRWGAAHTLAWPGGQVVSAGATLDWSLHIGAVEWELSQWRRATTVIRGVCPELALLDGIGGQVLEVRGEMFLSGTVRLRYEHARSARRRV